ncbi:MAG: asparagine synthase (glutamine-hydrolyzing) [Opitutaceae bacterium]|nr:asparagine synthase (glutamine-hydrolyzing) [Opitutaceae bacterium]
MCGIAGIFSTRVSPADRVARVERMCAALVHRGPDEGGQITRGPMTLGVRRLAIIDPQEGHQPWQSDDARYTLVFNGALLNFRELRTELESHGRAFRTECDTEVVLASFLHWGEACYARFRGMFAFAVWDDFAQTLVLVRDPFGIKPLYVRTSSPGHDLEFASEIRALRQGCNDLEIDPQAVEDALAFLAVPAPRTVYRGVTSLLPGECARWKGGRLERVRFWDFSRRDRSHSACTDGEEFTGQLRQRLADSVRAHLIADVPVGFFLSGGLDSTSLVALATQAATAPVRSFSVGFDEPGYSESEPAAAAARHLGCDHQTLVVSGARLARDLERILAAMDQPTGDAINTFYASEAARAGGVRVVLSGLGADELFGGYGSFRELPQLATWQAWWRWIPAPIRRAMARVMGRGSMRSQKLWDCFAATRDPNDLAATSRRVWSRQAVRLLTGRPGGSTLHPAHAALRSALSDADSFERLSAWELQTYMSDVLLRDGDVMSMHHSLELRVPFVDRPLIEWLWCQPSAWRNTPAQPKSALAKAVADLLPPGVAGRPKWGFTVPMDTWMRRDLLPFLEDTFSAESVRKSGFFEVAAVQTAWTRFRRSRDSRGWSRLWSLAVLLTFLNREGSR